jgi:hypothetical protein
MLQIYRMYKRFAVFLIVFFKWIIDMCNAIQLPVDNCESDLLTSCFSINPF